MIAKDIMQKRVITARPEMTLRELARLLDDHRISGVPVAGPKGIVGVVSQTDLVRHDRETPPDSVPHYHQHVEDGLRARGLHAELPDYTRVEEVMTPWAISFEEDTPIEELARQMLAKRVHRVLITNGGKLAGIVSALDLVRAFLTQRGRGARR